jgi:hypothetical protein
MSLGDVYRDPLFYEWYSTPFFYDETIKVIGGKALLTYVPDEFQRVQITGKSETTGIPQDSSQYKVNYQTGFVEFHSSVTDNTSLTATYYARGIIKHPAARTMLIDSGNIITADNVEDALQEIMNKINSNESNNQSRMTQIEQDSIDRDNTHANSTTAHPAENITYSGDVNGATNVKDALDSLDGRIDNIVAQAGTENTEIVDMRLGADGVSRTVAGDLLREIHSQQLQSAQQTQTISHGLNVINASQNSPLDIQIEGRTLVNVSQNVLDPTKYYVLADKKSKVKFADGTTYTGVAKFQGKAEKPILIRVSNFENKVSGSTAENPHLMKSNGGSTSLQPPNGTWSETSNNGYTLVAKQDSLLAQATTTVNGSYAQWLFSFNLIEAIERNVGKIPATDKVTWLKNNITKLTCNWWGYGNSPSGYKANVRHWHNGSSSWGGSASHTNNIVTKVTISSVDMNSHVSSDGFYHVLAYTDPSDGVTASTIYTDYVELEIELNQNSQLYFPRFPLYEVTSDEYNNILVSWDETEVMRRYPMVDSVQHVQAPYVIAEGENLIPPFTEGWTLHANAKVINPYELELNATGTYQASIFDVPAIENQEYTFSFSGNGEFFIKFLDVNKQTIGEWGVYATPETSPSTDKTPMGTKYISVRASNSTTGTFTFKNPMLTLGSTAKPFVPRNPSYLFAEVKLGALSDKKDILFKDNGEWKVLKWIEKIDLDGSLAWSFGTDYAGAKQVKVVNFTTNVYGESNAVGVKYDGSVLKTIPSNMTMKDEIVLRNSDKTLFISVSDTDSGWGENYTPLSSEIKAYFYGWCMCNGTYGTPYNGTGTKTWYPIGDTDLSRATTTTPTSEAPTITEGKISYYKLSYVRSTPVTEVVTDKVEGDLAVNGATQVEVGSGCVIREKITPTQHSSTLDWYINEKGVSASVTDNPLKYRVSKILGIYRNGILDSKWTQATSASNQNGTVYATIKNSDYDSTSEYTVTYLLLDRHLFTTNTLSVIANYDSSLKSVVDSVVAKQADIATQVSVNVRAIAELYKRIKALGG